jgi:nucleotide-binding universal stress UspA family protein
MNFDFLVPIATYPNPSPEDGLIRALDMVSSITGKISVVAEEVDIPPINSLLAIGASVLAAKAEEGSHQKADQLSQAVTRVADRLRMPITVEMLRCRPVLETRMVAISRQHDAALVVVDPACPARKELAEAILFGSGGPVLVCLRGHRSPAHAGNRLGRQPRRRPSIARRPASARAGGQRNPFDLEQRQGDRCPSAWPERRRSWNIVPSASLMWTCRALAGRSATFSSNRPEGAPVLLVSGAYGRGRFRERVSGGATGSALHSARLPILMSH